MKKFLLNVFIFSSLCFSSALVLDIFISKNLKKSNFYTGGEYCIWNDIYSGSIDSEIVIYGSSRAWVHFDAPLLTETLGVPTYNVGIDGHSFWLQYLRHKILIKNNTKPKLIIYSVDAFTLEKTTELYNADQFLPYMWMDSVMHRSLKTYQGYEDIDFLFPLIRYYGRSHSIFHALHLFIDDSHNTPSRVRGFQGMEREWNQDLSAASAKLQFYEVKVHQPTLKLFEDFIKDCIRNNIDIIFVYAPEYIEGQKFIKNRDEILSIYRKLSDAYGIKFYDYSDDSLSFDRKYFYNSMHLNKEGAKKFTMSIVDKLADYKFK